MIGIGGHYGGPEHKGSGIASVIGRAMRIAARERAPDYDSGEESFMNPIFIVPGSLSKPNFVGIERGYFSRKDRGLVLKVAVPESVTGGDELRDFVVTALRDCARIAADHFASKGMSFSSLGAEKIIRAIERDFATS